MLPLGLLYGRRFAFIVSTIVLLGATIGCALKNSWAQHLALRIIQGSATDATESVSFYTDTWVLCRTNELGPPLDPRRDLPSSTNTAWSTVSTGPPKTPSLAALL